MTSTIKASRWKYSWWLDGREAPERPADCTVGGWTGGRRRNDQRIVQRNLDDPAFAVLNAAADVSEVVRGRHIIDRIGEIMAQLSSEVRQRKEKKTAQRS